MRKKLIDKDAVVAEIESILNETNYKPFTDEVLGERKVCKDIKDFLDTLDVKEIPKWKKTMHDNGCWSCEIGVNPSKRLYEYEHYTINADELFKLLDKEE